MPYLFDYVEHELATFDQKPFCSVDAAVLSQACMIDGVGVVPEPSAMPALIDRALTLLAPDARSATFTSLMRSELFDGMFTGLVPDDIRRLLMALAASPRFRDLRLRGYRSVFDESSHTQFAATTFTWRSAFSFVGFRGTDISATGWRENFDMTYRNEVSAQKLAREYLEHMAPRLPGDLHVGGHSKGGNLALYAALTCSAEVRERIDRVWCLDAPGFRPEMIKRCQTPFYQLGEDSRIERILPQDSLVGVLLECPAPARVVRSNAQGLMQHSVFTWEISDDRSDFVEAERLGEGSQALHDVLAEWLASMDDERCEQVVDALFAALGASGARDARDVFLGGKPFPQLVSDAALNLDEESRDVLGAVLGDLAAIAARRVGRDLAAAIFGE
ncbi:Mbeg1-like protein [Enorma phocaeensis]|uniref:Mbeg1-like protein n=1 Tax=Enorma phocaeensis TaxID=1871019 RepID=UPI000C867883|nr:Mbeg1-like protein [Enorma phocaeensis]